MKGHGTTHERVRHGVIGGGHREAGWRRSLPGVGVPAVDVALAVCVTAVTLWGCHSESNPSPEARRMLHGHVLVPAPGWAYLLIAAAGMVLIWRRRHPCTALGVSLAGVLTFTGLGYLSDAALIIPPLALYSVAVLVSARRAMIMAAGTLLALGAVVVAGPVDRVTSGDIALAGLVASAVLAGIATANRRRYIDEVNARTELIERTQQEQLRLGIDAERLRIARELHDIVAHTMSTINVQAGVAGYLGEDLPGPAADALQAIRAASKDGLRELRAILSVLRQVDDDDARQPQPGLGRLDALVGGTTAAGLPTTIVTTGHPVRAVPAAVDLAAYRIVQESLTNVLRHAGPATATVHLTYTDQRVSVRITDTGRGTGSIGPGDDGHGLIGMRERAATVGGTLDAGPGLGGGFEVTAHLPLSS